MELEPVDNLAAVICEDIRFWILLQIGDGVGVLDIVIGWLTIGVNGLFNIKRGEVD